MKSKSKIAENASKSQGKSKYTELHMIIPVEDMKWALNQSPTIYKLFGECWASDPFGSRFVLLSTTLRGDNLRKAKKVIKDAGLFEFKVEMHIVAGESCYETFVINYHGSRSSYWKLKNQIDNPGVRTDNPGGQPETLKQQAFQNASRTSHKRLSNSSKELLRRGEDTSQCLPRESEKQSLTPEEVTRHLEGAKQGIMPETEIIALLREYPRDWTEFIHYAQVNKWDLSKHIPKVSNAASEMIEQIKAKKKKPRFQIDY